MGICLDTEQNNEELETTGGANSRRDSMWVGRATPPTAAFPMQNSSHVKFEPPNVPVIFVLGGPGSGKVTHCDNLMQERRGVVHINMTDLLQQYAIGNGTALQSPDMQDFGTLSSKTVTEVLMLEMKMAPTAKTYLVSGYPRSMRDVAEYSDKIQTITGVILVSWRQRVLERQIEYGARLGHVVLGLARMELANFYKHVMPVADYFDQTNMLIAVNGERNPEEVYKDFRAAVLQILGTQDDATVNGVSGVGVGAGGIPGEIVGLEPAPLATGLGRNLPNAEDFETVNPEEVYKDFRAAVLQILGTQDDATVNGVSGVGGIPGEIVGLEPAPLASGLGRNLPKAIAAREEASALPIAAPIVLPPSVRQETRDIDRIVTPKAEVIRVRGATTKPIVVWVVGGPGSNKAVLCQRAIAQRSGWTHFSLGQRLRALADAGGGPASDGALARSAISGGEFAPRELVSKLVRTAVNDAARSGHGIVVDGYPRDLEQMQQFEKEFDVQPRMVLLDCSKLQLGRGRRDDSVAAFRRRLELFRELSLPMLKAVDLQHRLIIVDGDTDTTEVQTEFTRVLLEEAEKAEAIAEIPDPPAPRQQEQSAMQQFTHAMSRMGNGFANGALRNGAANGGLPNGNIGNGFIGMASNKVKPLTNASKISTVSQMTHDDVRRLYEQSSGDVTFNTHM